MLFRMYAAKARSTGRRRFNYRSMLIVVRKAHLHPIEQQHHRVGLDRIEELVLGGGGGNRIADLHIGDTDDRGPFRFGLGLRLGRGGSQAGGLVTCQGAKAMESTQQ